MSQCSFCIAPANGEKPMGSSTKETCDRHCGFSPSGNHQIDPPSADVGEDNTLHLTCYWCGQAGTVRAEDVTWL